MSFPDYIPLSGDKIQWEKKIFELKSSCDRFFIVFAIFTYSLMLHLCFGISIGVANMLSLKEKANFLQEFATNLDFLGPFVQ